MKALIVDDEKHVRDAIRLLVPWDRFGIHTLLEAGDGITGIAMIESERPEIVFTDMMMPNAGGAELLEWVSLHSPNCKIIVISGHDDFHFVRMTVKYGGMDYILKPIDEGQLNDAVSKAVESWNSEERERSQNRHLNIELNRMKPLYAEQLFSNLINDPGAHSAKVVNLQQFGLSKSVERVRVALLSLEMTPPSIRAKFGESGWNLLYFLLTNICNEILRERGIGYALRNWGQNQEIVLLLWDDLDRVADLAARMNAAIFFAVKAKFAFGIGLSAAFPAQVAESYRQARQALLQRNLLEADFWCHVYDPSLSARKNMIYFSGHEERVKFAVQSGNKEQIRRALGPCFDEMDRMASISLEQLNLWRQELELAKSIWGGMDNSNPPSSPLSGDSFTVPVDGNGEFDYAEWKLSIYREACEVSERLSELDRNRSVIKDIAKYIERFSHEDITLQDISEKFYLSREYISRKFKQELKENLSDYITKVRITRAKELLANAHLKIAQIAELAGFQDEKYFSKVFKKWTRCTPNEYRKHQHGTDG